MVTITAHLVRSAYEAALSDQRTPEWPPHPARLFGALVAVADLDDARHREVLDLMECATPPELHCPNSDDGVRRKSFVVSNDVAKESKYQALFLREATGTRTWPRTTLSHPEIRFCWPGLSLSHDQTCVLDEIAKRVGYLGRSTCPAMLRVEQSQIVGRGQPNVWRPLADGVGISLRVPAPGYLALLERAIASEMSAHEIPAVEVEYTDDVLPDETVASSPYEQTLAIKQLASAIDGRRAHELTQLARRAFLERLSTYLPQEGQPASLCGHANLGETTWTQIMFLPLLFVGHERADGTVKGLGLALPRDLERPLRIAALAAWRDVDHLTLGSRGRMPLAAPGARPVWSLRSSRWTHPACVWVSATPVVPGRFCTSNAQRRAYVVEQCLALGLPEPEVLIDREPRLAGALRLGARRAARTSEATAKPNFHAVVIFPERVAGPIVLGDMRHYGLGLFVAARPDNESGSSDDASGP